MVAMVEAYFDESGTGDESPFLCVAGYIFTKENAAALDSMWREMLNRYELPYFHMSECAHGVGIYKHLTRQQCIDAATEAIELIKRYASRGIAISLDKSAYPFIPKNGIWNSPYSFLCGQAFYGVRNWANETRFAGDASYFFESGAEDWAQAAKSIEKVMSETVPRNDFRFHTYSSIGKTEATPVQCADLLAWHWFTHNKRILRGETKARADFKSLIGLEIDPHHYDKEAIERWLIFLDVAKRQLAKNNGVHSSLELLSAVIRR
ncbi:DUF3800 domain-containing protein [Polaromonas sp. A23]|uniref:DUF3800 domain-containing protein n=1 Tax=Polaromonas sp. A23 TaxID=1944133 RepID=UPI00098445BC|nr:DUF3800 domain-containing protein [Polaromonas sp. A23]OOG43854.1 hypothetical protein B0B52_07975 [Polaromonas sp. A23]